MCCTKKNNKSVELNKLNINYVQKLKHMKQINKIKLKKVYFISFIFSILAISLIIVSVMLINMTNTAEGLAKSLINRATNSTKNELNSYFETVKLNLLNFEGLTEQGLLNINDLDFFTSISLPSFKNIPQLETVMIADMKGRALSLIREKDTWLISEYKTTDTATIIEREEWTGDTFSHKTIKKWTEVSDYNINKRLWFSGAVNAKDKTNPWWTNPYTFFTLKKVGITVSIQAINPNTGQSNVIMHDILLSEISEFTINQNISKNSKVFILTKDFKVLGLPNEAIFNNQDTINKYVLKDYDKINSPVLQEVVNYQKAASNNTEAFEITINNKTWWAKTTPFVLGSNRTFYIGVAVPEKDFLEEIKFTRNIVIGGFLIIFIFILIVINQYIQKRKTNLFLEKQKLKIEAQNNKITKQYEIVSEQKQEISDSILYAKRIQEALLPHDKFLDVIFDEHFILLKPLNIVSGDFYWFKKHNDYVIIAAADSTGHGVPGAFMSMLGISFLNDIVRRENVQSASDILDLLRDYIKISLKQKGKEGGSTDGMDVALYVIHIPTLKLQYSGAYNSLFIIPAEEDEKHRCDLLKNNNKVNIQYPSNKTKKPLIEIKADRQPVSIYAKEVNFTNHEIQLKKGDILYTFSDGYQDQFGGEHGKKFKSKKFKQLLVDIHKKDFNNQKQILETQLTEWMGETKQIDDILVVGLKI